MDVTGLNAEGFARVAARVVPVVLADPVANARAILADATVLAADGVRLAAYPELCLTGATCGDLFFQDALLDAAETTVAWLCEATRDLDTVLVVGTPVRRRSRLYDCAAILHRGALLGLVPRSRMGDAARWFGAGEGVRDTVAFAGREAAFDPDLVVAVPGLPELRVRVAVGDDAATSVPTPVGEWPQDATVLVAMAASPAAIGRADERAASARATSRRCACAVVGTNAGPGESSTDAVFDGATFVYECGEVRGESGRWPTGPSGTLADVDVRRLMGERGTGDRDTPPATVPAGQDAPARRFPFVAEDPDQLARDCTEAFAIQVHALARRVRAIGAPKLVLGVSGGLDSTQALLVCARTLDLLGRPRTDILAFTMPGFATTEGTKSNALALMETIGATAETLDIRPAATQMLADLGHAFADGEALYDITFENVQAGLRADYLFRLANQRGGVVVGTGDLSELALGWCTYGVGDHMSHYGVNAGVPKTLLRHLIAHAIRDGGFGADVNAVLARVLEQEISPELVPGEAGGPAQSTEAQIGPYDLNDFFLYHVLAGERPSRIAALARQAWGDSYDAAAISGGLRRFYQRFFTQQFKRTAMPDGPQVTRVSLSPRSGWRAPSDAVAAAWLAELDGAQ